MRWGRAVWEVARWEFLRYVKPKQQLIGMVITVAIFGAFMWLGRGSGDGAPEVREVAVLNAHLVPVHLGEFPGFRFVPYDASEEADLRERVAEGELDGLLVIRGSDEGEMVVRRRAGWAEGVRGAFATANRQQVIEREEIPPEVAAALLVPPRFEVTLAAGTTDHSRGERIAVVIVLVLMLLAIFTGMSYVFVSITGEKQIRVTEQVVSAIPAQAWIDGKILGLAAVSVASVAGQVVAFGFVYLLLRVLAGTPALPIPASLGNPGTIAVIVAFGVIGLFFWFAFLGAVAATIDDPNSSTRGSLLLPPILASAMAFTVLGDPDRTTSRVLALLPPTAPGSMPARMLTTEVSGLEVALSLALLVGGTALLRVVAGRIFRLGMLMYGKEPSWSELRRWALGR